MFWVYHINMTLSQQIHKPARRSPINLTIREDLMTDAQMLGIDPSEAAEAGILDAIYEAKRDVWRSENKEAIEAYNAEIRQRGVALPPIWGEIGV